MIDDVEGSRGLAPLETRTFHRILFAMPELSTAAWLIWVWLRPVSAGADAVRAAMATLAIEGPLLVALFGLMVVAMTEKHEWRERWCGVLILCASLLLMAWMATQHAAFQPSFWLLGVVAAGVLGKWGAFREGRQQLPIIELLKLAMQFIVLLILFDLSNDAPRLGFVEGVADRLGLPEYVDVIARPSNEIGHAHPIWGLVAAAAAYMTLCGSLRFLLAIRPRRADRGRRSTRAPAVR